MFLVMNVKMSRYKAKLLHNGIYNYFLRCVLLCANHDLGLKGQQSKEKIFDSLPRQRPYKPDSSNKMTGILRPTLRNIRDAV